MQQSLRMAGWLDTLGSMSASSFLSWVLDIWWAYEENWPKDERPLGTTVNVSVMSASTCSVQKEIYS